MKAKKRAKTEAKSAGAGVTVATFVQRGQAAAVAEDYCRKCECMRFQSRASVQGLALRVRAELDAVKEIVESLLPLSPDARARVLLVTALRDAPNALTEQQMLTLLRAARNPNP